jgi:hypothetical protein
MFSYSLCFSALSQTIYYQCQQELILTPHSSCQPFPLTQYFLTREQGQIMTNVRNENGTCGCGRSPTGDCIGWHALTPEEYEAKTNKEKEATFENSK